MKDITLNLTNIKNHGKVCNAISLQLNIPLTMVHSTMFDMFNHPNFNKKIINLEEINIAGLGKFRITNEGKQLKKVLEATHHIKKQNKSK
jgi:hypothetical protein